MDRFKFRAWCKWGMVYTDNTDYEIDVVDGQVFKESMSDHVGQDYIMQSTGIRDKNGVLIYEGDILKDVRGALVSVGVIMWRNDYAQFTMNGWDLPSFIDKHCEVIGNKYEKPELVEG
jgi:hypothetical protein